MTDTVEGQGPIRQVFRWARWSVIAGLLALPAVAMRFTGEVQWTISDFVFAGVLLVGAGLIYEIGALRIRRPLWRTLYGAGVVAVVLLIWVEAAVGLFH